MKVAIAEKRDVARKIARVIGADADRKDWFEGNGYCVTWCQGHLLELRVPESEGRWTLDNLPILPERFGLGPVSKGRNQDGSPAEDPSAKHRLRVIKDLIARSDGIVCCTDAAREGQLIFDNVYRWAGIRRPVARLWISSLTERAIRDGFRNLRDNREYDNLAAAARERSRSDWMVGVNATRAFTLTSGAQRVLSLGRVQTPTLCMVCERFIENRDFRSEPFWTLRGETAKDGTPFPYRGGIRYKDKAECERDRDSVINGGFLEVASVTTERKNEDAPLLHDLASLQKAANSRYSLTAHQTLDAAQSLYEKQYLSYPRTGSRFIPEDIYNEVPDLLRSLAWHPVYGEAATRLAGGNLNRRSVNETKVTDHHGLIITGKRPEGLSVTEEQVYELVLTRFIEAFSPVCIADVTTVVLTSGDLEFTTRGRKEISLGWKAVCKEEPAEDVSQEEADAIEITMHPLPQMSRGDRIPVGALQAVEDVTKPKPLLTDATLLSAMENAGRRSDDKAVANALKGIGIGTPATRDSVIEEIIRRGYVVREKKRLLPTELGLGVYHAVRDKEVANVAMTARWETALEEIADGTSDGKEFARGIRAYTEKITGELMTMEGAAEIGSRAGASEVKCPRCGKQIRLTNAGTRCACGFALWREVAGKRLTDEQLRQLAGEGRTGVLKGFRKKDGSRFDAALALDAEGKTVFSYPGPPAAAEGLTCPRCGSKISFNAKGAWCPSCRLSVWREVAGKKLSDQQMAALLKDGRTRTISGFTARNGKKFDAALVLDGEGKVRFEFNNNNS